MHYSTMTAADHKYPKLDKDHPRQSGWLKVSDEPKHQIHYEEYGNPQGEPIIFIHGGPGGGIPHEHLRAFNPEKYRIIAFDQRGCGKSRPHVAEDLKGAMANNITQATIDDIEALRAARGLGSEPAHIYGGSWGSTAAIAYAQAHPDHVKSLNLRGIFLCDKEDLSFFYQGNAANLADESIPGAYRAYTSDGEFTIPKHLHAPEVAAQYKEAWEAYVAIIPPEERGDMIGAYHERLNNPKYSKDERMAAARAWSHWEDVTSFLNKEPDPAIASDGPAVSGNKFDDDRFALAFATIENEYFYRSLRGQDPVLAGLLKPENIAKLKDIPTHVVQGGYDQVCVPSSARRFRDAVAQYAGGLASYVETEAGHALTEKPTFQAVAAVADELVARKQWRKAEDNRPAPSADIAK